MLYDTDEATPSGEAGAEDRARIARILRRAGFAADPVDVVAWSQKGHRALIDHLVDEAVAADPLADLADPLVGLDEDADAGDAVVAAIVDRMVAPQAPLLERMVWYWTTHFTTSIESTTKPMVWEQYRLIRGLALGNFAELARAITTDAAMLIYLDGAGSWGDNPNENHSREMLELFALGREGGYTEADVRAAARILAGWNVDWDTGEVWVEPDRTYDRPVTFMGERRRWTVDGFVEFLCSQPACARHVARRMYRHFVGSEPTGAALAELAEEFRGANLEIAALIRAILARPELADPDGPTRVRQPLEWLIAARRALGLTDPIEPWHLWLLGQVPYSPPNVAGWPLDARWGSAGHVVARTSLLFEYDLPDAVIDEVWPTASAVAERCGLWSLSPSTQVALERIEADVDEYDGRLDLLFTATLNSPEFLVL